MLTTVFALLLPWICLTDSLKMFYSDLNFERKAVSQTLFDEILKSPLTQFVPVSNGDNFYIDATKKPIFLNAKDLEEGEKSESAIDDKLFIYLGSKGGVEFVAVDFLSEKKETRVKTRSGEESPPAVIKPSTLPLRLLTEGIKSKNLRSFSEELVDADDASLLAHARGMVVWHTNTQVRDGQYLNLIIHDWFINCRL